MLLKWFLELRIDQPAFDASMLFKSYKRRFDHEVAHEFFAAAVRQAMQRRYVSSDHFSVDGTLLDAWALHKSLKSDQGATKNPIAPHGGLSLTAGPIVIV